MNLAAVSSLVENGSVYRTLRSAGCLITVLAICLHCAAQYQDSDTRGVPKTSASAPPPEMRVDINHATIEELIKIHGLTRSWAGRIVRFRPYRAKTDLLDEGVVTSQVYTRIKDWVIAHRELQGHSN